MQRRQRSCLVRTTSLWSLLATPVQNEMRGAALPSRGGRRTKRKSRRFIGDIVHAPVFGRVSALNDEMRTVTLETHVYLPHAILAPVSGILVRIDVQHGTLLNGVFTAQCGKEAGLALSILCQKSGHIVQLTLVAKPHGATSRIRMSLAINDSLVAGAPIGYAGGTFETRLLLPPTGFLSAYVGVSVRGHRSVLGTVYRTL